MSDESAATSPETDDRRFSPGLVLLGAGCSILFAIPLASVTAAMFRFPVPFAGYLSGVDAVVPAAFAALFYICLGGFLVLGAAGIVMGILVSVFATRFDDGSRVGLVLFGSAIVAELGVFVMAVLDKLIGNW